MNFLDALSLFASITLFVGYHRFLARRLKRDPYYTVHALNNFARMRWVESVMQSDRADILAVQTLRNSVMASSFMASTAILLMIGTLTVAGSAHDGSVWHTINLGGATHDTLLAWKLVALIADFFIAFFCFAMAVRFFTHTGYMINVPPALRVDVLSPAKVAAYLNRAGTFYVVGTRSFFYSVPLVFWLFGPPFMVASTVVVLLALYRMDRAPVEKRGDQIPV